MDDRDVELRDALASEGDYRPEDAAREQEMIAEEFQGKQRRIERYMWVHLVACCWVSAYALQQILHRSEIGVLLRYGLLALALFEATILIKLWYWIVNNKLSLLESVKRMEAALMHGAPSSTRSTAVSCTRISKGLARWERAVWMALLIGGGICASGLATSLTPMVTEHTLVRVGVDGVVRKRMVIHAVSRSRSELWGFSFVEARDADMQFLDAQGRKLEMDVEEISDTRARFRVHFNEPVGFMQEAKITLLVTEKATFDEATGEWSVGHLTSHGTSRTRFRHTIELPPGAEVVEPGEFDVSVCDARPVVSVNGRGRDFAYGIRYKLKEDGES